MKLGLQARYSIFVIALVVTIVGLMSVAHLFEFRTMVSSVSQATTEAVSSSLYRQTKIKGESLSRLLATSLIEHVYRLEISIIEEHVKALSGQPGVLYVAVLDPQNRVLAERGSSSIAYKNAPMGKQAVARGLAAGHVVSGNDGSVLHLVAPVQLGTKLIGCVKLGLSLERIKGSIKTVTGHIGDITKESGQKFLTIYSVIAAVIAAVIGLLGLGISLMMVRNLSGFIHKLARYARRIGVGRYDETPPPNGAGELGELAKTLEEVSVNLKQVSEVSRLATLGEMAVGMAHELNQPLNTIRLASENAQHAIEDGFSNQEFELSKLRMISEQSAKMGEMIQRMCVVGRSEGPLDIIDPRESIGDACSLLALQFVDDGIIVTLDLDDTPLRILGSRNELAQVLINFMTNARDAIVENQPENMDRNPGTSGRIDVILDSRRDGVVIQVKDNGGGIPDDVIERIFDPFFTTKEVTKGTGLGLSISFGIINAMGGQIKVENFGGGAIFTLVLPKVEADHDVNHDPGI